jgi:hypothetical protein
MGYKHETILWVMTTTKGGLPMKTGQTFDITEKARIYHTMAQLTSSFSSIVRYCEDLERAGVLTAKYRHLFQAFTVEVQSQINGEILEHMDSVEMADSARGSRVREKWERWLRFEDEEKPGKKKAKSTRTQPSKVRTGS